jgi:dTDP-glucose 4,6-dehydratase
MPRRSGGRLIVTGGAGFIGSAAVCRAVGAGHDVLTIDKLTYAGRGAALAESALRHWSQLHGARHDGFRFVHVSTDEVFGTLAKERPFDVKSRYAPNSPYAASKAAADHLARAWHRTYGIPVIITNCSNNYGPWQHAEKLIPTVIRYALAGAPIPIYGTGRNIRDWLYVDDHVTAIAAALRAGLPGDTYLFGGRCEMCNFDVASMVCSLLDARRPRSDGKAYSQQITFVVDRAGHDLHYAVDPSHAEAVLGWTATEAFTTGLAKTIDWYLANMDCLMPVNELGRLGTRTIVRANTTSSRLGKV